MMNRSLLVRQALLCCEIGWHERLFSFIYQKLKFLSFQLWKYDRQMLPATYPYNGSFTILRFQPQVFDNFYCTERCHNYDTLNAAYTHYIFCLMKVLPRSEYHWLYFQYLFFNYQNFRCTMTTTQILLTVPIVVSRTAVARECTELKKMERVQMQTGQELQMSLMSR